MKDGDEWRKEGRRERKKQTGISGDSCRVVGTDTTVHLFYSMPMLSWSFIRNPCVEFVVCEARNF